MKEYKFKINGNEYNVAVKKVEGKIAEVNVNGVDYSVEMENAPAAARRREPPVPEPAAAAKDVTSPLPGVILSVNVAVGDKVKAGQKVAVLEAMKMENDIESDFDGTVTAIHVNKGDSVLEGAKIVSIA